MRNQRSTWRVPGWLSTFLLLLLLVARASHAQVESSPIAHLVAQVGAVEIRPAGAQAWKSAAANQRFFDEDRLRTLDDGQATLQLEDFSELRMGPRSELAVAPGNPAPPKSRVQFQSGKLYFLDRNRPREIEVETPVGAATVVGTEFVLEVEPGSGATVLTLVDGKVILANPQGRAELSSGDQGVMERNQAPRKTAVISAQDAVQWLLYYPGVLDLQDLALAPSSQALLAASLAAYREGDLARAMALYPVGRKPATPAEGLYLAALQISGGLATHYESILDSNTRDLPGGVALQRMIAAIRHQTMSARPVVTNASQWLAESYYRQSRHDLSGAQEAALRAAAISPKFGFAWERVAELEFSFGRIVRAQTALARALALSPRNAQAHALSGFLLLAREQGAKAETAFARAIQIDPMLGNAWLGRGLGRIHAGRVKEGRVDLQTAAIMEPSRWVLRSYLAKAYAEEALSATHAQSSRELHDLAVKELALAARNDPFDPTPWLYSALIAYNEYRIADAIGDLQKSEQLNDDRQVYRSRLLLDEDQAVRSANLADIYKDAGMTDVSLDEASRAVAYDYANFSAHLNLASTYDELRDPTRFNLRYESEWFNETLLAGMLAPPGAISLSENLSQQEYSSLFARDRVGLQNTSEYFGNGELRATTSQYGSVEDASWALDLYYQYKSGFRVNNQLSQIDWDSHIKEQITPQDSLYIMTTYEDYSSGDQFQYYDQSSASPSYHLTETQTPMLLAGWHHEWTPGSHTLFLVGRLQDAQQLTDTNLLELAATRNPTVTPGYVPFNVDYSNQFVVYSAELNQIIESENHTDIFGARYQEGVFQANALLNNGPSFLGPYASSTSSDAQFERISAYEYHHWEMADHLMIIGGVAYDTEEYPADYRRPPLNNEEAWKSQWSPKAALIWNPAPSLTIRCAFARALGGVSYDESVRLEPTQIAGFDQSFRSIISESLIGSVEAGEYQIAGGAIDWKPFSQTWLTLQAQSLRERVSQNSGYFSINFGKTPVMTAALNDITQYDYRETGAALTLDQIIAREWFVQAQYKFAFSDLETTLGDAPAPAGYNQNLDQWGTLQQARFSVRWQSTRGFFSQAELLWYGQALGGAGAFPAGDDFAQVNLYVGYRFPNRRGDLTVGVLNLTGGGYELSPINYYLDLPYQRLLYLRVRFNF